MDDIHGTATPSGRNYLSREIEFRGGDGSEVAKPCEHLKRLRKPMTDETLIQPNTKYLESDRLMVLTHRATMDATRLLTVDDTRLYRSCVGALVYYALDRADALLEASISVSCL